MQTTTTTYRKPIRFGEFLLEQRLISEEQLLAALADHWSNGGRIGLAVCRRGFLSAEQVERQAAVFHALRRDLGQAARHVSARASMPWPAEVTRAARPAAWALG